MKPLVVLLAAAAFSMAMIEAMLALPTAGIDLRQAVMEQLPVSGVDHPVTAVLLNYRGYDTLLEIAVLLLALFGLLALGLEPREPVQASEPALQWVARLAVPMMVIFAIYMLWAGAHRPGGAFQAGAVLGAVAVLLHLTELLPGWEQPRLRLRFGLSLGFLLFLAIAAFLLVEGVLLRYPPSWAGTLILLIESGLTVSLGLLLGGLFLFLSRDNGGER